MDIHEHFSIFAHRKEREILEVSLNSIFMATGISLIIPFLNEGESIYKCCEELEHFKTKLNFPLEVVFVDDGSTDNTSNFIKEFNFKNLEIVKLISLSKNFGAHAAIRAGILNSAYEVCTWIGSDLQEPLEFIAEGYKKIAEGFDAVYIAKESIDVALISRVFSKCYSALIKLFVIHNYDACGVNNIIFNKKVKDYINTHIEVNSSLMLQIIDAGFKNMILRLPFKSRDIGKSKWTLSKKLKLFTDTFVVFSHAPLRFVSLTGFILFFAGTLYAIYIIANKILNPENSMLGYASLASILAIGFGITNISLGIIAEYLWRTFDAARQRQAFIVSEISKVR